MQFRVTSHLAFPPSSGDLVPLQVATFTRFSESPIGPKCLSENGFDQDRGRDL